MKSLFLAVLVLVSGSVFSQNCPFDNTVMGSMSHTFVGQTLTEQCVRTGQYVAVRVTNGSTYNISTCATSTVDVTITIYDATGANILATDDDGCGVTAGPAEFTGTTNFDGLILVLIDEFPCLNSNVCVRLDVTLDAGTPAPPCSPNAGTETVSSCGPFTWIDGNTYTSSNNSATYTIIAGAADGCDSTVNLDLTITNAGTRTDIVSTCGSYTWIDGNTYTSSNNTATYIVPGQNGCDSLILLDLTIIEFEVINTDPILVASTSGASYQWLNCLDNFSVIPDKTSQSFVPASNGSYAVEVTLDNCVDTSDCYSVFSVGLSEQSPLNTISVYPNPFKDVIFVELSKLGVSDINVFNLQSQLIYSETNISSNVFELKINEPSGIYILEVIADGEKKHFKVIRE